MFLTNFGNVFSRSQCIINIRAAFDGVSNETKMQSSDAMLTIVDLAGAEREKRTGNQVILFCLLYTLYMEYVLSYQLHMQSHKYMSSYLKVLVS